jgi:hypothetical protein
VPEFSIEKDVLVPFVSFLFLTEPSLFLDVQVWRGEDGGGDGAVVRTYFVFWMSSVVSNMRAWMG